MGDVAATFSGGTPSVLNEQYYNGSIPFIKSGELGNKKTEQAITKLGLKNSSAKMIKSGTLLYALYGATSGECAISPINGAINQAILAILPYEDQVIFLLQWLNKNKEKILKKYLQGGQGNLSASIIKKLEIPHTKSQEELLISKLFNLIDNLLSLQQRKAQQLKLLKKAMLQDIFPNTQGIRQIKLSNNIWVEKRMVDIFKEKNIRSKNGELLSVSISKGIYPFSNSERKNNSSIDKSNYKKVTPGDIAYNSMRMWQGALGVSKYNGIVSPAYTVMATKEKENPLFYYYYFKNTRMMFNFRQHSQGLTSDTWNLKFPLLKEIAIQIPINKNEEEKIIKLFESIDIAITSIELKIEKLKAVKQFLLQNMFI